jgi:hypothetical protein
MVRSTRLPREARLPLICTCYEFSGTTGTQALPCASDYPRTAPQLFINSAYSSYKNYHLYFSSYCSHNLESCTVGFRHGVGVVAESA